MLHARKAKQLWPCKDSWSESCCHCCFCTRSMLIIRAERCLLPSWLIGCSGSEAVDHSCALNHRRLTATLTQIRPSQELHDCVPSNRSPRAPPQLVNRATATACIVECQNVLLACSNIEVLPVTMLVGCRASSGSQQRTAISA